MYAGGQFELGVGRAQIQAIASLFYPNGPNDCAPGGLQRAGADRRPAGEPARRVGVARHDRVLSRRPAAPARFTTVSSAKR